MAGNNFCIDLRLKTECAKELDLTPNPETPYQSIIADGKVLVLCPAFSNSNVCLTDIGVSSTVIGYDIGLGIGSTKPDKAPDGTLFYGFTWDYPAVKGDFIIKWGIDGKQQLTDVQSILVTNKDNAEAFVAHWDESSSSYKATNIIYAEGLNTGYDSGEIPPWCFNMFILPDLFIHYDFVELKTGDQI